MTKIHKISEQEQEFWFEFTKDIKPLNKKSKTKIITQKPAEINIVPEEKSKNNSPEKLKNNEKAQIDTKKAREIKKKGLKIETKLDLHGLTQELAYNKLCRFIESNWLKGVRNLLIITGKGKDFEGSGILKQMLPKWLAETKFNKMILHITMANPNDGGNGAFYVVLRKKR